MSEDAKQATAHGRGSALQLKLSLHGVSKPPVWRRLLVPADMRLDRLHDVIQTSMGWTARLHGFSTTAGDYGVPDPELGFRDERNARLGNSSSSTATASGMCTTSAIVESTTSSWRSVSPSSQAGSSRRALRARARAHRRTAEDPGATRISRRRSQTQVTKTTTTCSTGWVLERAAEFDPAACGLAELNEVLETTVAARN